MTRFHQHLQSKSRHYKKWHEYQHHHHFHWLTFGLTSLFCFFIIFQAYFSPSPIAQVALSAGNIQYIVVQDSLLGDPAYSLAINDLKNAFNQIYGYTPQEVLDDINPLPDNSLIIGNQNHNWVQQSGLGGELSSLKDEGYIIRQMIIDSSNAIVIAGKGTWGDESVLSVAYGTFYFIERFKLDNDRSNWNITRQPAFPIRIPHATVSNEDALRMGINHMLVDDGWPQTINYNNGPDSPGVNICTLEACSNCNDCLHSFSTGGASSYHLKTVTTGDQFTVPEGTLSQRWDILEYAINQFFDQHSDIDVVLVSIGRTRPVDNPPNGFEAMNILQDDIPQAMGIFGQAADSHDKTVIVRTWDDNDQGIGDSWHTSPSRYQQYTESYWNLPIVYQFKPVQGDYGRYMIYNPVLDAGLGGAKSVEWQTLREFEGSGMLPAYLGEVFLEGRMEVTPYGGLRQMLNDGVVALTTIAQQKGIWERLNGFALSRSAWDVNIDEHTLAKEWVALELGLEFDQPLVETMAQALEHTDDVLKDILYMESYAKDGDKDIWNLVNVDNNPPNSEYRVFGDNYRLRRDITNSVAWGAIESDIAQKKRAAGNVNNFLSLMGDIKDDMPNVDLGQNGDLGQTLYNNSLMFKYWTYTFRYYLEGLLRRENNQGSLENEAFRDWEIAWDFYENHIMGSNYEATNPSYRPPVLDGADFGAYMTDGSHDYSYMELYQDDGMVNAIGNFNSDSGIYPEQLVHFSKFSDGVEFELYLGLPNSAQSGNNYLITADLTNMGGFFGENNATLNNLTATLTVGNQSSNLTFSSSPLSGQDIPTILQTNWTAPANGQISALVEFDYNGTHYIVSGEEANDDLDLCNDGTCTRSYDCNNCGTGYGDCSAQDCTPPGNQPPTRPSLRVVTGGGEPTCSADCSNWLDGACGNGITCQTWQRQQSRTGCPTGLNCQTTQCRTDTNCGALPPGDAYPRVGFLQWGDATPEWDAKFDLIITPHTDDAYVQYIKSINPTAIVLPAKDTHQGDWIGRNRMPDEWWIRDSQGNKITIYGGSWNWADYTDYAPPSALFNNQRFNQVIGQESLGQFDINLYDGLATDGLWVNGWYDVSVCDPACTTSKCPSFTINSLTGACQTNGSCDGSGNCIYSQTHDALDRQCPNAPCTSQGWNNSACTSTCNASNCPSFTINSLTGACQTNGSCDGSGNCIYSQTYDASDRDCPNVPCTNYGWNNDDIDLDRNGVNDLNEYGGTWVSDTLSAGAEQVAISWRNAIGPNKILFINSGAFHLQACQYKNGLWLEHTNGIYNSVSNFLSTYQNFMNCAPQPRVLLEDFRMDRDDFMKMRFGLTLTLLGDGYFGSDAVYNHYGTNWYDEYETQLGYPTADYQPVPGTEVYVQADYDTRAVYARFFDNGVSLVNTLGQNVTVSNNQLSQMSAYDGPYYRFQGGQNPNFNNGQQFASVTLLGNIETDNLITGDGIILLKNPTTIVSDIYIDNVYTGTSPNSDPAELQGNWKQLSDDGAIYTSQCHGQYNSWQIAYRHWSNDADAYYENSYPYAYLESGDNGQAIFQPTIGVPGNYAVYEWHGRFGGCNGDTFDPQGNEATNVGYTITYAGGTDQGTINQRDQNNYGKWNYLGTYYFNQGQTGNLTISGQNANGVVIADAIKFVYQGN